MIYDLIILGGGPAGAAGAVYAARKQLRTLLVTAEFGGQSSVSTEIYNWIGTETISGSDLAGNLKKHIKAYEGEFLTIKESEIANGITKLNDHFSVSTDKGSYEAKTALIVTGSSRRKIEAKNADIYENKGLTYCATCDGPLFSGQDVVVIGGGNAGFESAAQLLAYCKSVTLLHRSAEFRADEITVNAVLKNPKMKAIKNLEILEITGDKFVNGIVYKDKITNEIHTLPVTGIFVEIGQIPNTGFASSLVMLDENKKIKVDPRTQMTSIEGIWAAGDCTDGLYHQNNIAAGDAVKALENIYMHLHTK
ncbi:MAG: FAD-dependent oxidoreductase [Candidatus Paceibacterota bacterium]|jgi:alkyl hydroperoxide reductase subunit F